MQLFLITSGKHFFERRETFPLLLQRDGDTLGPNFSQFSGLYVKLLQGFEFAVIIQIFVVILYFVFLILFAFLIIVFLFVVNIILIVVIFIIDVNPFCGPTLKHIILINTHDSYEY